MKDETHSRLTVFRPDIERLRLVEARDRSLEMRSCNVVDKENVTLAFRAPYSLLSELGAPSGCTQGNQLPLGSSWTWSCGGCSQEGFCERKTQILVISSVTMFTWPVAGVSDPLEGEQPGTLLALEAPPSAANISCQQCSFSCTLPA